METFDIYHTNGQRKLEEDTFFLFSPYGVLYFGNMDTGDIKWLYDTNVLKEYEFQAMQPKKWPHVAVGEEDGNTLHVFPSKTDPPRVIPFDSNEDLKDRLTKIFGKGVDTSYDEDYIFLSKVDGKYRAGWGMDNFKITLSRCFVWVEGRCGVIYKSAKVSSPLANENYEENYNYPEVFHARSVPKFIELCDMFNISTLPGDGPLASIINGRKKQIRLLEPLESVPAKDHTRYFKGTIGNGTVQVFVKRVRIERKDVQEKIEKTYKDLEKVESVAKLLMVEKDKHHVYYAFELFDYTLDVFMKENRVTSEELRITILRGITTGLQEMHSGFILHGNICPQNILIKLRKTVAYLRNSADSVVIKFCGVCSSEMSERKYDKYNYASEKQAFGRTCLNLLSEGKYLFKEGDHTPGHCVLQFKEYNLKSLRSVHADLIQKLVFSSSMTLNGVIKHVIFWRKKDFMYFLVRLSRRLSFGHFADLDPKDVSARGRGVFTNNWIRESEKFKNWFMRMIYADESNKKYAFPRPNQQYWAKEAPMIRSEHDTSTLRGLVIIVRNTFIHGHKDTYPTTSTTDLLEFINELYPDFFMALYNFMLSKHPQDLVDLLDD